MLMLCAGASSGLAAFLTNPFDLVKLRLQTQASAQLSHSGTQTPFHYSGFLNGLATVAKNEGIQGFFRGSVARMWFFAPSAALNLELMTTIRDRLVSEGYFAQCN